MSVPESRHPTLRCCGLPTLIRSHRVWDNEGVLFPTYASSVRMRRWACAERIDHGGTWWEPHGETRLAVTDVDCTIWCGLSSAAAFDPPSRCTPDGCLNEAVIGELKRLAEAGWRVAIWSGWGAAHAQRVRKLAGLEVAVAVNDCYEKPYGTLTPRSAVELLGAVPDLQFDDDETEAIDGVKFVHVDDHSPHGLVLRRIK